MGLGNVGKDLRLRRLFNRASGRAVVVAMDHGIDGAVPGLENIGQVLDRLFEEEPDGVLMNAGMFRHWVHKWQGRGAPNVILAGDIYATSSIPGEGHTSEEYRSQASLEHLIANGADAIKVFLIFGQDNLKPHADNLAAICQLAEASSMLGLPVMVEPVNWGPGSEEKNRQPGFLAHACRIAVELGADIIKAPYVPDVEVFSKVVESCPVPILMLGGSKSKNLTDLFKMTEQATTAGVKGLVYGRNVWQQSEPDRVLRCLNLIVHESLDTRQAMEQAGIPET